MGTWRDKASGFLRKWQSARHDVKQAKNARRDERQAEELEMAKDGLTRRPGGYSW